MWRRKKYNSFYILLVCRRARPNPIFPVQKCLYITIVFWVGWVYCICVWERVYLSMGWVISLLHSQTLLPANSDVFCCSSVIAHRRFCRLHRRRRRCCFFLSHLLYTLAYFITLVQSFDWFAFLACELFTFIGNSVLALKFFIVSFNIAFFPSSLTLKNCITMKNGLAFVYLLR